MIVRYMCDIYMCVCVCVCVCVCARVRVCNILYSDFITILYNRSFFKSKVTRTNVSYKRILLFH